jgi:hypothetical protein
MADYVVPGGAGTELHGFVLTWQTTIQRVLSAKAR